MALLFTDFVWSVVFYATVFPLTPGTKVPAGPPLGMPETHLSSFEGGSVCHRWAASGFTLCMQRAAQFGGHLKLPRALR